VLLATQDDAAQRQSPERSLDVAPRAPDGRTRQAAADDDNNVIDAERATHRVTSVHGSCPWTHLLAPHVVERSAAPGPQL
jgi:hypothetical protein